MHEPNQGEFDLWVQDYARSVGKLLADTLPPVSDPCQPGSESQRTPGSFAVSLTRDALVQVRMAHESKLVRKAVRTSKSGTDPAVGQAPTNETAQKQRSEAKARRLLAKEMDEVLHPHQTSRKGTGAERRLRWKGDMNPGNSANAAVVADAKATEV